MAKAGDFERIKDKMEIFKKLIVKEKEMLLRSERFHIEAATKEKCIHRLHWAERQRLLLHQLYACEKEIEIHAENLFQQNPDPDFANKLIDIFVERIDYLISHYERENGYWDKICDQMKAELDRDAEMYKSYKTILENKKILVKT